MDIQELAKAAHELSTSVNVSDPLPIVELSAAHLKVLQHPTRLIELLKLIPPNDASLNQEVCVPIFV